jgi:CelD/BcsL family acetyltransferase involved in cellulose biosynthesis
MENVMSFRGGSDEAVAVQGSEVVEISRDFETTRDDWATLASRARPINAYQSYDFLRNWFETFGRSAGVTPFIVVARKAGRPVALLPFCRQQRAGLGIGQFLGGRESNFNLPLLDPGAGYDAPRLRRLLRDAAARAPERIDVFYLRNQPRRLDGAANPLAFANARPSASFAYGVTLPAREEELAARLSKDARKKLRKKEQRLAELGPLVYEHQATGARAQAIIDALIRQKSDRFAGLCVDDLRALLTPRADGAGFELHALRVGDRIVATYAGLARDSRFSAMVNSFDMDPEIARASPGELLLHALMRHLVSRGFERFDLGAGEARYKQSVCDETIELCDAVVPVSPMGHIAAPLLSAYLRLKRRAKRSQWMSRLYYHLARGRR